MDGLWQDFRYAFRSLRHAPQISIASIICISLGLGINAVTFGLTNAALLRSPPGVESPEKMVRLHFEERLGGTATFSHTVTSYPDYQVLGQSERAFTSVAAYYATDISFYSGNSMQRLAAVFASGTYFPTLGVRPILGKPLPLDDRLRAPLAIVSYGLWKRQFAGASDIVGRTIRVNGFPVTVMGVAPKGFVGVDLQPADIWLPISLVDHVGPGNDWMSSRFASWLTVIARLAPHVKEQQAARYATKLLDADSNRHGPLVFAGGLNGSSAPERMQQRSMLIWVSAAALVVLLIACVNVALLLLARGEQRSHEMALRLALGASRRRLVRQLFVESALLAVFGMAAGIVSLTWAGSVARVLDMPSPTGFAGQRVILFVASAALMASVGFGVAPAVGVARVTLRSALSADRQRAGGRRSRGQRFLITAQVALSFMLLVTAATFVTTLRQAQRIDVGADIDHLLLVSTPASGEGLPVPAAWRLFAMLRDNVAELRGVESASLASTVPFVSMMKVPIQVPYNSTSDMALVNHVGMEYRGTIGTPLLAGRWFVAADTNSEGQVAVISLRMARRFWPGVEAVGKCFHISDLSSPCTRIIGVTGDAKYTDVYAEPEPLFYLPARGHLNAMPSLIVRTSGDPGALQGVVQRSLQRSVENGPYVDVVPFTRVLLSQTSSLRSGSALFFCFGLLSLGLSCFGLHGLLSFIVARRAPEFGVRLAMGADNRDLVALVGYESARLVGLGVLCGTLLAVGTVSVLRATLRLNAVDPIACVLMLVVLSVAAAVASFIPALRAGRTPPAAALRQV